MDFSAFYPLERYPFFSRLVWRQHAVFDGAIADTSGWKDGVVVLHMQNQGFSSFWELECLVPLGRECFVNDLHRKNKTASKNCDFSIHSINEKYAARRPQFFLNSDVRNCTHAHKRGKAQLLLYTTK